MYSKLVQRLIHLSSLAGCAMAVLPMASAQAQSSAVGVLTSLHSFMGTDGDGAYNGVVQGSDGNFYGTTYNGGNFSDGNVFKMTPDGTVTNLYSFSGVDGSVPEAGLVEGSDGSFYGSTTDGGIYGFGTLFKITPDGVLSSLHSFNGSDGAVPFAKLVQGSDGNFYGTTVNGGASDQGVVFGIAPDGTLSDLHSFAEPDGAYPYSALVQGGDGNFYGTTSFGGASDYGTVFEISPAGAVASLYAFSGGDGGHPYTGLVPSGDGGFYGLTTSGGAFEYGTAFRIAPEGSLTTLYNFMQTDGDEGSGLMLAGDGNLYGTMGYLETPLCLCGGSIYQLTPTGLLTTLYYFPETGPLVQAQGSGPGGGLIQGGDGDLYGTTGVGGSLGVGTVFKLAVASTDTATPVITPASGSYRIAQQAAISDATPGAVIYYTTDGGTPTAASKLYGKPIPILVSTVLRAAAVSPDGAVSEIASATYTISRRRH